jgi:opacity protein-like surface antigen
MEIHCVFQAFFTKNILNFFIKMLDSVKKEPSNEMMFMQTNLKGMKVTHVHKMFLVSFALGVFMNISPNFAAAGETPYVGMSLGISKTNRIHNNALPIFAKDPALPAAGIFDVNFKTHSNAGLRVGYEQQAIRTEFEAATFYSGYKTIQSNQTPINFSSGRTKAISALLNVYYDVKQLNSEVYPFVGLGAGMAIIKNRLFLPDVTASISDKKCVYQGITGLMFNIVPKTSMSVDYRYFGTQRLKAFNKTLKNQSINLGILCRF